jgi:hypothetical protein
MGIARNCRSPAVSAYSRQAAVDRLRKRRTKRPANGWPGVVGLQTIGATVAPAVIEQGSQAFSRQGPRRPAKKTPGQGGTRAQVFSTQRSLLAMGRARAIMVSFGAGCKLV